MDILGGQNAYDVGYSEGQMDSKREIEQYKHTLEYYTKEIKLLTAEIDQKDKKIERLKQEKEWVSVGDSLPVIERNNPDREGVFVLMKGGGPAPGRFRQGVSNIPYFLEHIDTYTHWKYFPESPVQQALKKEWDYGK